MQSKRLWGSAFAASLGLYLLAIPARAMGTEDVGPRFTMEYLSAQWEIEEKVERLRAKLEAEKGSLEVDRELFEMSDRLFKKHAVSKEEYLANRAKFETTRAMVAETQASIDYLSAYSLIFGYRVKIAASGKVSDLDYAKAYLNLWKSQSDFNFKSLERHRHEHEYLQWTSAVRRELVKKGASTRADFLISERKVIVAHEHIAYHRKRIPVLECIVKEFQKIVDEGGKVDPQIPAKSPCKSDIRPQIAFP